ncbi:hypothetical protein [Mucilaginibacter sp.]
MIKESNKEIIDIIREVYENRLASALIVESYSLSVHNHWLNVEEADKAYSLLDFDDYLRFTNNEILIVKFFIKFNKTYSISYFNDDLNTLNDFENEGELIDIIIKDLREIDRFVFYVESMDLLFISIFDQEVGIYFISHNDREFFIKIVQDNGLYLLD